MATKRRPLWVVKVGSSLVQSGGLLLIRDWMRQLAVLRKTHDVVWVTSGAIVTGADTLHVKKHKRSLSEKQALSAIGQSRLMDHYNLALQACGLQGAQILLTQQDLARAPSRRNLISTVRTLLGWKVTPILNENDAVATDEIRFGDNDQLSAQVARALDAQRLVILSDVDGLYAPDLLRQIRRVTPGILSHARARVGVGSGGMRSKLEAARLAQRAQIPTRIARGDLADVLLKIARDQAIGTEIVALQDVR